MAHKPEWAKRLQPILSYRQVADLLQVSPQTVRDWSSRGLFYECVCRVGNRIGFVRDRVADHLFTGNHDHGA